MNTKLGLMGDAGTEILGRFFLSLLIQATQRRSLIDKKDRKATFAYIDECQDYIAREPKMAKLLDKARKQRVALTLSHQRMSNIENLDVRDALQNTRTKFFAANKTDAPIAARLIGVEPEALMTLPDYTFAFHQGKKMMQVKPPPPASRNTQSAYQAALSRMRERYCAPPEEARDPIFHPEEPIVSRPPPPSGLRRKPAEDIDLTPTTDEW